jgi:type VI secretion system lysozyme-like protein
VLRITERLNELSSSHYSEDDRIVDQTKVMRSIVELIEKLLNTRTNSVSIDPEYGVPEIDFSKGLVDESEKSDLMHFLEQLILRFEKRIVALQGILFDSHDIRVVMAFRLQAQTYDKAQLNLTVLLYSDNTFAVETK